MRKLLIQLGAICLVASACAQTAKPLKSHEAHTYTSADVETAVETAQELRREGKFEEALNLHLWYHKNALKYDPAQYGVRLSFALSDWVALGESYPPALHALRAVRNEALTTYRKVPSDSLMFGEVMSIDMALDDLRSAKSLFYEGRKLGVEDDLMLELQRIIETGDLKWVRDVIGDPLERLEKMKRERQLSLSGLGDNKELVADEDAMFSAEAVNILTAVAKVSGMPAALRAQKKALTFLKTPEVRNALISSG